MSAPAALRIGTRGSALALWQAEHVRSLIGQRGDAPAIELVRIRTEGDVRTDVPLWQAGGRAFFTKEIDKALLSGEVDLAVHSLKDLSTVLEPGIVLAAVLKRADPRDALLSEVSTTLSALPKAARVGTSSLRRRAFLARLRPDLELLELRGNVPTRLEQLRAGRYDALVLATAGLVRLGLEQHIAQRLAPDDFPPAVSQGAIGVCARAQDETTRRWLAALDDGPTRLATTAERALLRRIEGGCQVPLGALGTIHGEKLQLSAAVCALDGARMLRASGECGATAAAATDLGRRLAEELLAQGAGEIIAARRAMTNEQRS